MRKKTQNLTKKKQMKTSTRKRLDVKHGSCSKQKSTNITIEYVLLQPSGYFVFHGGDTPIQLGLP